MIVDLPGTTTNDINKKITGLREEGGAITLSRVLTLVISLHSDDLLEDSIEAANFASREHPCRVIVVVQGDRSAAEPRLDAQLRVGGDAGAGEVVALHLHGELADHASSVVLPFLLPDTPVVAWWPAGGPDVSALDPLGRLAIRRITNATDCADPLAAIKSRLQGYTDGDTDLAWARITYWRALLAAAIDQPPHDPITSAVVSGLRMSRRSTSSRVWPPGSTARQRAVGDLKVDLVRKSETITLRRPQTGVTATLTWTSRPRHGPLARRVAKECLAEDLRRLDADEIYHEALQGIDKVQYV
jgi:glucose-6-phosphate dehydrogenase assembly protein OpcA